LPLPKLASSYRTGQVIPFFVSLQGEKPLPLLPTAGWWGTGGSASFQPKQDKDWHNWRQTATIKESSLAALGNARGQQ
jgi:hypothetical protein